MSLRNVLLSAVLIGLTACSNRSDLIQTRQRSEAPRNAQDLGLLLDGATDSDVTNVLADHPTARVRVLSRDHGLYEIFGVEESEVQKRFKGDISKNQYFAMNKKRDMDLFSTPIKPGTKIGDLDPCQTITGTTTATLTVEAPKAALMDETIEAGTTVRINSSLSADKSGKAVKTVFVTMYPDLAPQKQVIKTASSLEFNTDTLGLHKVFLVAQGADGSCAMDAVRFLVTANRPYTGPQAKDLNLDLSKFTHLAEVSAQDSWTMSEGQGITIAILDTGVNYNHPSLAPNILINAKEIPANGIDDDNNGFIDDVLGYDFVNQDAFPFDDDSHGTHVAGLAASRQMGMARKAKILPVKALSSMGGDAGTTAAAIRYAVDRGANIINMSLGGGGTEVPSALQSAVAYAEQKGVLIMAAAGNGAPGTGLGYSVDNDMIWPVSLASENMVGVASFDAFNVISPYSNFGAKSVHVVAPGGWGSKDPVYSCAYDNPRGVQFIGLSGTSMATPVVSGIAAQVWSHSRNFTYKDVKAVLIAAGKDFPELKAITASGRHIDAVSALQLAISKDVLY